GEVGGWAGVRASYSDDRGLTWTKSHSTRWIGGGPGKTWMRPFYAAPYRDQVAMIAVENVMIWTSYDGAAWTPSQTPDPTVTDVYALASWASDTSKLYALLKRAGRLTLGRLANGSWGTLSSDPVLDDGSGGAWGSPVLSVSNHTL